MKKIIPTTIEHLTEADFNSKIHILQILCTKTDDIKIPSVFR